MQARLSVLALVVAGCGGAEPPPPAPSPAAVASVAPPAPVVSASATTAPVVASAAPAATVAPTAGCKAVEWDKPTTLAGKASKGSGQNGRMETEKYIALDLAAPICGPDGKPVNRIQLIPMGTWTYASLSKLEKKSITVGGSPSAAMTAHHHETVVFEVKTVE